MNRWINICIKLALEKEQMNFWLKDEEKNEQINEW